VSLLDQVLQFVVGLFTSLGGVDALIDFWRELFASLGVS
jgi:Ca2+/Na+ antiporter